MTQWNNESLWQPSKQTKQEKLGQTDQKELQTNSHKTQTKTDYSLLHLIIQFLELKYFL